MLFRFLFLKGGGYFVTLRRAGHFAAAARGIERPSCDILYTCNCFRLEACSKSWLKLFVYESHYHTLSAEKSGYRKLQNKVDHKSPVGKESNLIN